MERSGFAGLRGLLGGNADAGARAVPGGTFSSDETAQALHLLRDYEASGLGWFWSTDAQGNITYISDCVAQILGKAREDLVGTQFHALFTVVRDEDDRGMAERTLPLMLNSHKTFSEILVTAAGGPVMSGDEIWLSISGRAQFGGKGKFSGFYGNGRDVTHSRRSKLEASRLAMYDTLTGLANRNRMNRMLDETLRAYAMAKRNCAIMVIDLDRFKQVNDTFGHQAGDALLKQVAERMQSVVGGNCEVGRIGGDEFQVILPDLDDRGHLGELAKRIIALVSSPYTLDEGHCIIGASIGVAIAPFDGIDPEALFRAADMALYSAKAGGRGQFRFYSAELHVEAERRRQLEQDLGQALKNNEIHLLYNPQVDSSNQVVSLQASLAWQHPDFESIPTEIFMSIAEESGLIGALNEWALRRACEDVVQLPGKVKVAVPVSPEQLERHDFPALVAQALANPELAPERLELELPEAIFGSSSADIEGQINALKMLGVRIVLSGFGEGRAALQHLRRIGFDKLKIGETFVRGLVEGAGQDRAIVKAIVGLVRDLRMVAVAQGVATHAELDQLRELGVAISQGSIFSQLVPFADAFDAMARGDWIIEPSGPQRRRDERRSVLRNVGLIHENYRYEVRLKNLSCGGCLIEGLLQVPLDTQFVVDFGNGQLSVATVMRSAGVQQALEFELPLVDDGAGGLVTRNRVSPYVLASAGMPLGALPPGSYPLDLAGRIRSENFHTPKFAQVESH